MGPPYKRIFYYFKNDASAFIDHNRPGWTNQQRDWTISTIWAGDGIVKDYYVAETKHANGRRKKISPGLPDPNPIPVIPLMAADGAHAPANAPPPAPGAHLPPVAAAPTYVDSNLHYFWPRLPWDFEPDIEPVDMRKLREDEFEEEEWVKTKPHIPPPNNDSNWHGIKLLGSGGYGLAGLWVQADEANNICDRMVIKETKTFRSSQWRDPKNWRHRLPQEIRIHELLEERRATDPAMCRHVIRSRTHRLWMKARRYRLYLDYHAGGDINRAMGLCASNWRKKERANESIFLPEGFVWYTIKALATACLVLHEGTTAEDPVDGWRPITHLDLHLPNVLLDVSNHPVWRDKGKSAQGSSKSAKPGRADANAAGTNSQEAEDPPVVPILADFGISFFSPENECPLADNPGDYVLYEADTRYAPEMQPQDWDHVLKLGEKTDVWGIGSIAWSLLCNKQATSDGPIRCHSISANSTDPSPERKKVPLALVCPQNFTINDETTVLATESSAQSTAGKYGQEIKDLVRKCLNHRDTDRPTLREVIAEADGMLTGNADLENQIMDAGGLHLVLPDTSALAIGQPVDAAKRK